MEDWLRFFKFLQSLLIVAYFQSIIFYSCCLGLNYGDNFGHILLYRWPKLNLFARTLPQKLKCNDKIIIKFSLALLIWDKMLVLLLNDFKVLLNILISTGSLLIFFWKINWLKKLLLMNVAYKRYSVNMKSRELIWFWEILNACMLVYMETRRYLLCGNILGVLTHKTAWVQIWGGKIGG